MGIVLFIAGVILFIVGVLSLFRSIKWFYIMKWHAILEIIIGVLIILFGIFSFFQ